MHFIDDDVSVCTLTISRRHHESTDNADIRPLSSSSSHSNNSSSSSSSSSQIGEDNDDDDPTSEEIDHDNQATHDEHIDESNVIINSSSSSHYYEPVHSRWLQPQPQQQRTSFNRIDSHASKAAAKIGGDDDDDSERAKCRVQRLKRLRRLKFLDKMNLRLNCCASNNLSMSMQRSSASHFDQSIASSSLMTPSMYNSNELLSSPAPFPPPPAHAIRQQRSLVSSSSLAPPPAAAPAVAAAQLVAAQKEPALPLPLPLPQPPRQQHPYHHLVSNQLVEMLASRLFSDLSRNSNDNLLTAMFDKSDYERLKRSTTATSANANANALAHTDNDTINDDISVYCRSLKKSAPLASSEMTLLTLSGDHHSLHSGTAGAVNGNESATGSSGDKCYPFRKQTIPKYLTRHYANYSALISS